MRTEAGKMPESLIFLTENNPGVSNDRFGFNCFSIIIEMQASSQKSYRERAIYYSGKALSRQGIPGEGWDFERLAKVTNVESLPPDERYAYERDLKAYRDYKAQMDYAPSKKDLARG